MPTAETSTKVNYCNLKRSICDKAGAPFFLSRVCQRDMISPIQSGKEHQTASENYIKTMSSANIIGKRSRGVFVWNCRGCVQQTNQNRGIPFSSGPKI